jgi:hypothetical protein
LRVFPDGKFACAAVPGCHAHRQVIWQLVGPRSDSWQPTCPPRAKVRQENFKQQWRERAQEHAESFFKNPWTLEQIREASPAPIPTDPVAQALALVRLFPLTDVIWIGQLWESGRWRYHTRFRPVMTWLETDALPGPRISPSAFRPGVITRRKQTVLHWRFLVIESDSLPLEKQGALIRSCMGGLNLRAVVHTAGRSLHGWFDLPNKVLLSELQAMLPHLGCDPALFNPAQPVRLPGWPRTDTGAIPSLIYLNP